MLYFRLFFAFKTNVSKIQVSLPNKKHYWKVVNVDTGQNGVCGIWASDETEGSQDYTKVHIPLWHRCM